MPSVKSRQKLWLMMLVTISRRTGVPSAMADRRRAESVAVRIESSRCTWVGFMGKDVGRGKENGVREDEGEGMASQGGCPSG